MSYRFLKVTTFYKKFLDDYYQRNPFVMDMTYTDHKNHLMSAAYGWADFFERNLKTLGVDSHEIVANADCLQQRWAYEHGMKISGKELVLAQIIDLKPDIVLFQDSFYANGEWIEHVRNQVSSIKQAIGWCSAPFSDKHFEKLRAFDYIMACAPHFVNYFNSKGIESYLMYHAFEPALLPKINQNNNFPYIDLIFFGSLISEEGFHNERIKIIKGLVDRGIDLNIYTHLHYHRALTTFLKQGIYLTASLLKMLGFGHVAKKLPILNMADAWRSLPRKTVYNSALHKRVKPPVYGLEMLKAVSRAKIGFNAHIDVAGEYAGNSRLFEVTGVGACLLTDWKTNLPDLFLPDYEIVTYRTADECIDKINWLFKNPAKMAEIAKAGQSRTLKDHTFLKRAVQLDEIIKKKLK